MELSEINTLLQGTGYSVAYQHFDERDCPSMPFICYSEVGSDNFGADGIVYHPIKRIEVHLFTKKKDTTAEGKVEQALSSLFWQKSSEWNEDELCYRTIYDLEV